MSRILSIVIWLTALATVCIFQWSQWRLPRAVSAHAATIDRQYAMTLGCIAVAFFLVHLFLGFAIWQKPAARGADSRGHTKRDILWTAVTASVFVFLAVTGQRAWNRVRLNQPPAGAIPIEVTGQQFNWNFRYAGADGRFGRTDPRLYNDADNSIGARPGPLGIDPKDAAGKDDVVAGAMVVPVNRPIAVTLRAKDVTHDFYVPALRLKQDAVPGMKIILHFTATEEGRYEIACAELCGQLHHQMRAYLEVKSQAEFEKWMAERTVIR
jgi:cytochrome c oxidase subunit 2